MSERVKRALHLREELSEKRDLINEEEDKIKYLGRELNGIRINRDYLTRKTSTLASITREMTEDIFSLKLTVDGYDASISQEKKLSLDKKRNQLKVLREVKDKQIEEERILKERKEEIIKAQAPHKMVKDVLSGKIDQLRGEYEILLQEMDEDEVPEELRSTYEYYLPHSEEEDSDDEDEEDEEPEEPVIKTFFVHDTCCACQEKKPDIFNIPCGHVCMCASCNTKNSKSDKCAICRRVVKKFYAIKSL